MSFVGPASDATFLKTREVLFYLGRRYGYVAADVPLSARTTSIMCLGPDDAYS